MTPKSSRKDTAYNSAVKLVIEKNYTLRDAVAKVKNGTNRSTLARRVKEAKGELSRGKAGQGRALSTEQEQMLARVCLKFASQGVPITKEELVILVQQNYGASLHHRFVDGKPGRKWLSNFCKRNNLSFEKPNRQASERCTRANAEILTTHITSLGQIMGDFNIDAERLFNLDETGMITTKDCHGASMKKASMTSSTKCDRRAVRFRNEISKVTLMACVSATGCSVLPLWIFKGCSIPCREAQKPNGGTFRESVGSLLPPGSIIGTRPERGGIDTRLFQDWCSQFVERVSYLTANNRKVLLMYDGSRSHLSLKALQTLQHGNVEAYALPSHTSGVTQPLDASVFSPFKHHINEALCKNVASTPQENDTSAEISIFDLCRNFQEAYKKAFTIGNIVKGFEKTGVWPYCSEKLLSRPLHKSAHDLQTIVSEAELVEMVKDKRSKLRGGQSSQGIVILKI